MFDFADLPRPVIRYAVGLWRRRWLAVGAVWAAALGAWFAVWLLPDRYESRAQVYVQTESILEPVMSGVTARPDYESRVRVMRQQLLSRPNVEEIIYRSGLDATIRARSELGRRAAMEKLIDSVAEDIRIESPQEMYFEISYRFPDREVARNVVDAVVNLLIEQDLGASLQEKEEARRLLDAEIARFDARLTEKERAAADFRRRHADELVAAEGDLRRREQLELALARVTDDLARERQRVLSLRNVLARTPRTTSEQELDALRVRLAELRSQYREEYPDIQNVKARIAELEAAADALPSNPEYRRLAGELATAEGQVEALAAREADLKGELEALAFRLGQAPGVEAELQRLVRDYEQTRKSYEELVERRDRLMLTTSLGAGGQGVEYRIFERPTPALRPAAPPRLALILGALVLALAVGLGVAMLAVRLDRSFTQGSDLEAAFGLPVLGAISEAPSPAAARARRRDLLRLAGAGAGLVLAAAAYVYIDVLRLPADAEASAQFAEKGGPR